MHLVSIMVRSPGRWSHSPKHGKASGTYMGEIGLYFYRRWTFLYLSEINMVAVVCT